MSNHCPGYPFPFFNLRPGCCHKNHSSFSVYFEIVLLYAKLALVDSCAKNHGRAHSAVSSLHQNATATDKATALVLLFCLVTSL